MQEITLTWSYWLEIWEVKKTVPYDWDGIHDDGEEQRFLLELNIHDDHDHPDGQGGGLHGSYQESSIPGETGFYLSGGRFYFYWILFGDGQPD